MVLNVPSVSCLLEDVRNPYTFLITDIDRFICRWQNVYYVSSTH